MMFSPRPLLGAPCWPLREPWCWCSGDGSSCQPSAWGHRWSVHFHGGAFPPAAAFSTCHCLGTFLGLGTTSTDTALCAFSNALTINALLCGGSLGWTEGKEVFLKGDFKPNDFCSCSLEGLGGVGGNMERTGTRGQSTASPLGQPRMNGRGGTAPDIA